MNLIKGNKFKDKLKNIQPVIKYIKATKLKHAQ